MSELQLSKNDVIGIIGGGQLALMMCEEAHKMGFKTCIYSDKDDSPAFLISNDYIKAEFDDENKIAEFLDKVKVVTFEFENIPSHVLEIIENKKTVRPNSKSLKISQNRIREKNFFNDLGIRTARFFEINNEQDLKEKAKGFDYQAILKTSEFGYDGKGQFNISTLEDLKNICPEIEKNTKSNFVLEEKIKFERELSIVAARDVFGDVVFYPLVENHHKDGILDVTIFPAENINELQKKAEAIAQMALKSLDYVGVLAIEFFVVGDGLIVNEFAPRPHNSGHFSIDACEYSQFYQAIAAASGFAVKAPNLKHKGKMVNVIGDEIDDLKNLEKDPRIKIHDYRKLSSARGRKMAHYTILND
jgi:5-(carboxyamino)imidazole ribonucleotide synthase